MLRHKNRMISAADYHVKRFCEMPWKECILLLKCYGLRQKVWRLSGFGYQDILITDACNFTIYKMSLLFWKRYHSPGETRREAVCVSVVVPHTTCLLWGRKAMPCGQGQKSECSVSSSAVYSPHAGLWGPLGSPPSSPPSGLGRWSWCKAVVFLPQRRSGGYWETVGCRSTLSS